MKSRTLRAGLAFITATAAVVGFTGPSQAASVDGQTYSFPLEAKSAASASGNAAGTVNGTSLDYTIFADDLGADVDSVVMHWHTGTSCDDAGAIELDITSGGAVDLIDERFVIEGSIALGATDMENVYFNVHNADGLGVLACGELDATPDPLLASPESKTITVGTGLQINTSGIDAGGSITLEGSRLQINLDYTGDNLADTSKHMLMLRSTTSCDATSDVYLVGDNMRTVSTFGSTEMLAAADGVGGDNSLIDVYNNTFWSFTAGPLAAPDELAIDTELVLSAAEADALRNNGFSLVLHGNEGNGDTSRPAALDGLTVEEAIPANCLQVSAGFGSGTALAGNYYSLAFASLGGSNIAGGAYLKNTTTSAADSVQLVTDLSANSPTDTANYKFVLHDGTCDAPVVPFGIGGDDPEIGGLDGNTGRLRSQMALSNATGFTGPRAAALNNGDYVVVVTDNTKATALACASMQRIFADAPEAPEPPSEFDGTVAEASTIDEILAASDYRSNAANKGTDQEILRLYTAFFNREPDAAGVKYWIAVSKGEEGDPASRRVYNTLEIAEFFMPQQEFI
ncbi:MAG: hypothetical protein ACR2NL_09590, partial [Acidimicrobiia bacterium]